MRPTGRADLEEDVEHSEERPAAVHLQPAEPLPGVAPIEGEPVGLLGRVGRFAFLVELGHRLQP